MAEVVTNSTGSVVMGASSATSTGVQESSPAPAEKTFTQAELDTIVARRLAKAQKGMPDEAELTAFRAWKENQQTEQQKMESLAKERDEARNGLATAQAKIEQYERERYLLSKGISADDVDYYAFKAGKLVDDNTTFEQAADAVIQARAPKEEAKKETVRVDFGAPLNGGNPKITVDEIMAVQDDAKRQALIAQNHHLFGY